MENPNCFSCLSENRVARTSLSGSVAIGSLANAINSRGSIAIGASPRVGAGEYSQDLSEYLKWFRLW